MEAKDRRVVFVMPWKGNTLVGTTESVFHGEPGNVVPLRGEITYLMETVCRYFPRYRTGEETILDAFAGLRVLPWGRNGIEGEASSLHARSRETVLHLHQSGHPGRTRLLTVYGGKLTTYRLTAERVMVRLADALPMHATVADTRHLALT